MGSAIHVLAAFLATLASPQAARADAWDPGDDVSTGANVLTPSFTPSQQGPHDLSSTDFDDWYSFALNAGYTLHLDTIGGSGELQALLYAGPPAGATVAWDEGGAGNYDAALATLKLVEEAQPDNWQALELEGHCHQARHERKEAVRAYTRSLELHPRNPELRAWVDELEREGQP